MPYMNGGGKIATTKCDFSAPDFNAYDIPSQAVSDGADALLLAPSVVKLNQSIEIAKANKGRLTLLGNHSTNTYATLQQGQIRCQWNGRLLLLGIPTKILIILLSEMLSNFGVVLVTGVRQWHMILLKP